MTQEEIDKQYHQQMQDNITLDYSKWSFQQRRAKLSTDHDLWLQECERVRARQQNDNLRARENRLEKLAEDKQAEQEKADAAIDAELEPAKQTLKRGWLANNPTFTEADFEKKAWPHLRQNLIEQRRTDAVSAEIAALASTGRYSL